MKKNFTRIFALMFSLLMISGVYSQADVSIVAGGTDDWNKTYNVGTDKEIIVSYVGTIKSESACNTSANNLKIESSDTHWLDVSLSATANATLETAVFNISGNSETNTWEIPIFMSDQAPFDVTKVTGYQMMTITGYKQTCSDIIVTFPENVKSFRVYRRAKYTTGTPYSSIGSGSNVGSGQTSRIRAMNVFAAVSGPSISKTSGDNPATTMEDVEMTPIVYTYSNVADADNVLFDWYTDNTYTTTTTAPAGLSVNKDTDENTVTISGTPTTPGNYYYKVAVDEDGGNEIEGEIEVEVYQTPAPVITLTSANSTQVIKAGTAIVNIVYTLEHAEGASVKDLPNGVSGNYNAGTYTISGTVDATEDWRTFSYTVTAEALDGYDGDDVTATGSLVVKSPTAYDILYLTADGAPSVNDTRLYPSFNNNSNYLLTLKAAAGTAPDASSYADYDLIVLNEVVNGVNVEALALKDIDKPILNIKSFVYQTGRWGWGTADNGKANNGTITVTQSTHPIFAGITLNEGELELLSGAATKGIQPADVTIGGITVATAPKNASPFDQAVAIHDVPANVRGESITSKYLMIGLANDSYDKMTDDALTLLNNAVNYLINDLQFDPLSTSIGNTSATNVSFDGRTIYNPTNELIHVVDMSGRLVLTSNQNIDMNSFNKGIYIIHSSSVVRKIAVTK